MIQLVFFLLHVQYVMVIFSLCTWLLMRREIQVVCIVHGLIRFSVFNGVLIVLFRLIYVCDGIRKRSEMGWTKFIVYCVCVYVCACLFFVCV